VNVDAINSRIISKSPVLPLSLTSCSHCAIVRLGDVKGLTTELNWSSTRSEYVQNGELLVQFSSVVTNPSVIAFQNVWL